MTICWKLLAAAGLAIGATPLAAKAGSADARLKALYDAEWAWRTKEFGSEEDEAKGIGPDHLPRVDAATQQKRLAYWSGILAKLDAIPLKDLSPEEQINAAVFRTSLSAFVTDIGYKTYEAPFNSDSFFWTEITPRQGYPSIDEYRRYVGRLRDIPRYFDENVANMRAGLARGYTVPRIAIEGRDKSIEAYLKPGADNPFYAPIAKMPANIPAADRARITREVEAAISDAAVPAYAKLLAFIRTEYMPKARTELAAETLPDGKAYYQAMITKFATLDLTPAQIHAIGLKEVARIDAEMRAVMKKSGFKGSFPEFLAFLRTDPQFYATTPHQLIAEATYISKKADHKLKDTFGFLPRYRHGIVAVPDAIAPIYTAGRGGLETCLFNTYNLPQRPLYNLPALVLHECTPGHSFQAALALEGPSRPPFRRTTYFSGYGEGWGLYTEWLGTIMGIYETPYEDFGRLTYENWRASRLVIDTGIHQLGWSRKQAQDYLKEHTALSEHEITTEVDRYISWPGQAVAYKLGEMLIRRKRGEAEAKLGTGFDQRKFHDAILALGSVPLSTLETRLDQFIAAGGENPKAAD